MHAVLRLPSLIKCLAAPLAVHVASIYLTGDIRAVYTTLPLPPFAPSATALEVLRACLCLLMGAASYLISTARISRSDRNSTLTLYALVLLGSCLWNVLFFRFRMLTLSSIWIVLVFAVTALCIALFFRIRRSAGVLLAPALLWQTFAIVLSFSAMLTK